MRFRTKFGFEQAGLVSVSYWGLSPRICSALFLRSVRRILIGILVLFFSTRFVGEVIFHLHGYIIALKSRANSRFCHLCFTSHFSTVLWRFRSSSSLRDLIRLTPRCVFALCSLTAEQSPAALAEGLKQDDHTGFHTILTTALAETPDSHAVPAEVWSAATISLTYNIFVARALWKPNEDTSTRWRRFKHLFLLLYLPKLICLSFRTRYHDPHLVSVQHVDIFKIHSSFYLKRWVPPQGS